MELFDDAADRFDPSTIDFTFYSDLEAEEDAELFNEFDVDSDDGDDF